MSKCFADFLNDRVLTFVPAAAIVSELGDSTIAFALNSNMTCCHSGKVPPALIQFLRTSQLDTILIILIALAVDLVLGEPPPAAHPVVWMGKLVSRLIKCTGSRSPSCQFFWGMVSSLFVIALFAIPSIILLFYVKQLNPIAFVVAAGVLLKTTFSMRGLRQAALKIKSLLAADKLAGARFELRSLVGRDTSNLNKELLVSATVESVAENSCDSFFAPLFYFLILGVPGALGYRVINTLDAMIGHHGEFEYLGKFAARLDTIANFTPARITAMAIVLSSWICRKKASSAWKVMLRDRNKTESPNSGWTMSAIAGALEVQLEKVGYYKLGDVNNPLLTTTIDESLKIAMTATLLWSLVVITAEAIYHVAT
jgi:adenosylcobinamide-phosphate synthase